MNVKDIANYFCETIDKSEFPTSSKDSQRGKDIIKRINDILSEALDLNSLCAIAVLIASASSKKEAKYIVIDALNTINDRSFERGEKNERSALKAAEYFNFLSESSMTENDVWLFMICLKLARSDNSDVHIDDDYIDAVAYVLLLAESVTKSKDLKIK